MSRLDVDAEMAMANQIATEFVNILKERKLTRAKVGLVAATFFAAVASVEDAEGSNLLKNMANELEEHFREVGAL